MASSRSPVIVFFFFFSPPPLKFLCWGCSPFFSTLSVMSSQTRQCCQETRVHVLLHRPCLEDKPVFVLLMKSNPPHCLSLLSTLCLRPNLASRLRQRPFLPPPPPSSRHHMCMIRSLSSSDLGHAPIFSAPSHGSSQILPPPLPPTYRLHPSSQPASLLWFDDASLALVPTLGLDGLLSRNARPRGPEPSPAAHHLSTMPAW